MQGMDRYEAREAMIKDLDEHGLLVKVVPHAHNVGTHDRCKTTVEPMIKQQWFVKMDEMIKPAVEAVKEGEIKFASGKIWIRLISTGQTISVTGVFPDSFGGDTESRHITVMTVERCVVARENAGQMPEMRMYTYDTG